MDVEALLLEYLPPPPPPRPQSQPQPQPLPAMNYRRLLFAAEHQPSLRPALYGALLQHFRRTAAPVGWYQETLSASASTSDAEQSEQVSAGLNSLRERAREGELQLQSAKRDGDRGLIFRSLFALAEIYREAGDLPSALTRLHECKDWVSSNRDTVMVGRSIIEASLLSGNLSQVRAQAQKMKTAVEQSDIQPVRQLASGANLTSVQATQTFGAITPSLRSEIEAAFALSALSQCQYKTAAHSFLSIDFSTIDPSFLSLLRARDAGIAAALCAMATYSRTELTAQLMNSLSWRRNTEKVPVWHDILSSYIDTNYQRCFTLIRQEIQRTLCVDIHLCFHVENLFHDIQARALIQQFQPYTVLPLDCLADQLGFKHDEIEGAIERAIAAGDLNARIDTAHKTLIQRAHMGRQLMQQNAIRLGDRFLVQTQSSLLRMSMDENNIAIKKTKA